MSTRPDVTLLLQRIREGDRSAVDELMPLVYDELHGLASRYLHGERPGHTLQTTALVHEAFLRLVDQGSAHVNDRTHFLAIAATSIRRILIDHARRSRAVRRGGDGNRVPLEDIDQPMVEDPASLLELDNALQRLARVDERKGRVVELRFFGGLSIDETADVLEISTATVERDWSMARAWLFRELA